MTKQPHIFDSFGAGWGFLVHILLLDISGSMRRSDYPPTRLDAALDAAVAYAAYLFQRTTDARLGLIVFSDSAYVITGLTPVPELRKTGLDELRAEWSRASATWGDGDTNIGDALLEASRLLLGEKGPSQVVLLTDGEHNCGRDPRTVAPQLKRLASVATVGIGGAVPEVDEKLLREIASPDATGAPYYRWIGDRGRLVKHFESLAGRICRS